jgi:hypothetical protein
MKAFRDLMKSDEKRGGICSYYLRNLQLRLLSQVLWWGGSPHQRKLIQSLH